MRIAQARNLAGAFGIAVSALAIGCTGSFEKVEPGADGGGGGGGGGTTEGTAREIFDGLHPQLLAECQSCHLGVNDAVSAANGPDFMGADSGADAVHTAITSSVSTIDAANIVAASPADSKLFYYGSIAHSGSVGMTAGLKESVEAWIIARADEEGIAPDPGVEPPDGPGAPTSVVEALEMFASCMRYEDFTLGDFTAIANIPTDGKTCSGCHGIGEFGAHLNADPIQFYIGQRSLDAAGKLGATSIHAFVTAVSQDGGYAIKQTRRYEAKGTGISVANHPNYLFRDTNTQPLDDDVDAFFDATYLRYQAAVEAGVPCQPDDPALIEQ